MLSLRRLCAVAVGLLLAGGLAAGVSSPAAAGVPFSFKASPFDVRDLGVRGRPYCGPRVLPRDDPGIHDTYGVRMRRVGGRLYDFPRGQATYGLLNLSSYLTTHDQFFLDRAVAQAERLCETRVVAGDAWYYPNAPSKHRHGTPGELIAAPYYSALAQGRVLMFFSRLAEVTGLSVWREAADRTFASFLRPGPCSGPYVVNVDAHGYYWLQEWPWPHMQPDCTFNGHNSAAFGLYEYCHLTGDAQAIELFRGAVTTSAHYAGVFRRPGWISIYCLAHKAVSPYYHAYHVAQLLSLYRMTGAPVFARYADSFSADYPKPGVRGVLTIRSGRYTALRFSSQGLVVARRTIVVRRAVTTRVTRRQRQTKGGDVYLRVAARPCAGWWLAERPDRVFAQGAVVVLKYEPARELALAGGRSYAAVRLDERGIVVARVAVRADQPLTLSAGSSAIVEGAPSVRLSGGELGGYWVRLGRGARLL